VIDATDDNNQQISRDGLLHTDAQPGDRRMTTSAGASRAQVAEAEAAVPGSVLHAPAVAFPRRYSVTTESTMPWTPERPPLSMRKLPPKVRRKAVEIANALLREGTDEGKAIRIAIAKARALDLQEQRLREMNEMP
jgi:hypothetical protein